MPASELQNFELVDMCSDCLVDNDSVTATFVDTLMAPTSLMNVSHEPCAQSSGIVNCLFNQKSRLPRC